MSKVLAIGVGLILLILLLLFTTTYTLSFNEVAVKTRFGKAVEQPVVSDSGLKLKLPFFIDQVHKFDTRMQLVESSLNSVMIADGQQILVRTFLLWQVETEGQGPLDFFKAYGGIAEATEDLGSHLGTAMGVLGEYELEELLGSDAKLAEAETRILASLTDMAEAGGVALGIDALQVGISQIALPPATTQAVQARMAVTRQTLAQTERQKGLAQSQSIQADANTKIEKLRAFAESVATEIEAEGDEQRAIYLSRLEAAPNFAIFLTWLNAFEQSLDSHVTYILPPDMAPMHMIDLSPDQTQGAIPWPKTGTDNVSPVLDATPTAPVSPASGPIAGEPTP